MSIRHAVQQAENLETAVEVILTEFDKTDRHSAVELDQLLGALHGAYEQHLARKERNEPTLCEFELDDGSTAFYEV